MYKSFKKKSTDILRFLHVNWSKQAFLGKRANKLLNENKVIKNTTKFFIFDSKKVCEVK
jgi:hypothetical protein